MKLEKSSLCALGIFMLGLLIFLPGLQGIKQGSTSYSGVIERIDKDFKFIVVNGAKIRISGNATVVDMEGNTLKMDVLKPKVSVVVQGAEAREGFWATKIVITPLRRKP